MTHRFLWYDDDDTSDIPTAGYVRAFSDMKNEVYCIYLYNIESSSTRQRNKTGMEKNRTKAKEKFAANGKELEAAANRKRINSS